jgi:hypothetical protein
VREGGNRQPNYRNSFYSSSTAASSTSITDSVLVLLRSLPVLLLAISNHGTVLLILLPCTSTGGTIELVRSMLTVRG